MPARRSPELMTLCIYDDRVSMEPAGEFEAELVDPIRNTWRLRSTEGSPWPGEIEVPLDGDPAVFLKDYLEKKFPKRRVEIDGAQTI